MSDQALHNGGTRGRSLVKWVQQRENLPIFLVLVIFVAVVAAIQPRFVSIMNIRNVLLQFSITGIVTLGMTIVMISGGIDLSVGTLISFTGCLGAYLMESGISVPVAVLLMVGATVAGELVTGFIISRTDIEPFIVTLGMMTVYTGFTLLITNGSEIGIGQRFTLLGQTFPLFHIATPVYIFLGLTVVLWAVLKFTRFGRRLYAVGCNQEAAYLAGVNVKNFKLAVYGLNGLIVSIAMMALLSRLGVGNPLMGSGQEINSIAAAVVGGAALAGGRGNIWGSLIGVVVLGIISNAMNLVGVDPNWQYVMRGLVIIAAVVISYLTAHRKK